MSVQTQSNFTLTEKFKNLSFDENVSQDMSTDLEYEVNPASHTDKQAFIELARRCFNRDEPLNENIGLTEPDGRCSDLEDYIVSTIEEGTSVKAEVNGKLVAFSANGIMERDCESTKAETDNKKFQKILNFLDYNTKALDVFTRYPHVNKVMAVRIISVDPIMRGKGVATKLVEETRRIANEKGCQMMISECTSFYSALIFRRLGFSPIYSLKYSDYKVDGEVIFTPGHPHTEFKVYAQEL